MQIEQEISYDSFYKGNFEIFVAYCCAKFDVNEQDAEDMVSASFAHLWRRWDEITPHTRRALTFWMYSTMYNMRKNLFRCMHRRHVSFDELVAKGQLTPDLITYIDEIEVKQEYELFVKYLVDIESGLLLRDAELFHMLVVEKQDVEQIAENLGTKPEAVYIRWHRVKKKIQKMMPEIVKK